jgi:hypothetical protein
MAKIYQAGGGGRKKRGFQGTKIPESTAIQQQTKITLQGMQTVKDELRSQSNEVSRTRRLQSNLQESLLSNNVRQARENVRIIEEANLRDYKTKVLSHDAKKARLTFEQKQHQELMDLIPKATKALGQVDQLRRQSAAKWVTGKSAQLGFLSQAEEDEWFSKISHLGQVEQNAWWQSLNNPEDGRSVPLETREAFEGLKGYRALIRQSNSLSERVKNPLWINGVKASVDAKLPEDLLNKIKKSQKRLQTADPKFNQQDRNNLRVYNSHVKNQAFELLGSQYTRQFIAANGRNMVMDHLTLDRSEIDEVFQAGLEFKAKEEFTDKFINTLKQELGDVLKPKDFGKHPNTGEPLTSGLEKLILNGDTKQNMKFLSSILEDASLDGKIVLPGNGGEMVFGQRELDALGDMAVHGGKQTFSGAFKEKFRKAQNNLTSTIRRNEFRRDQQGLQAGVNLRQEILAKNDQGFDPDDTWFHGRISQISQEMGFVTEAEKRKWFAPALRAHHWGHNPPAYATELVNTKIRGVSVGRAAELRVPTTTAQKKMLGALEQIHRDPRSQDLVNGFLQEVEDNGNNKSLVIGKSKDYIPNAGSIAVRQESERRIFSKVRELTSKDDNVLTGPEALAEVVGKERELFDDGLNIYALKKDGDTIIEHNGRGYSWPSTTLETHKENSELTAKFIDERNLLWQDGSLSDTLVNQTVRSVKYGDRIPTGLHALKRAYPHLSIPQLQATIIHNHARESGLTDDKGNMILPGYYGFIQAAEPDIKSQRILNSGTPSAGVADQVVMNDLSKKFELPKKEFKQIIAESRMNPEVGYKYFESEQRWDAINTGDGWTLATDSLGKPLYETTIREVMQFPNFETSLSVTNDDLMHSIKEGTINLDNVIDAETHEKIFTDKQANESNKFYLESSFSDRPFLGDRFAREMYTNSPFYRPSLRGDIKREWEQDLNTVKDSLDSLVKGTKFLQKEHDRVTDPSGFKEKTYQATQLNAQKVYTAYKNRLEEQSKQFDEDLKKNVAISNRRKEQLKKSLKDIWQYVITPPEQEIMEALGNELVNYDMDINYFDKGVLTQFVNVLEAK